MFKLGRRWFAYRLSAWRQFLIWLIFYLCNWGDLPVIILLSRHYPPILFFRHLFGYLDFKFGWFILGRAPPIIRLFYRALNRNWDFRLIIGENGLMRFRDRLLVAISHSKIGCPDKRATPIPTIVETVLNRRKILEAAFISI